METSNKPRYTEYTVHTADQLETVSHRLKALANIALAIEEAMAQSTGEEAKYFPAVGFLRASLHDVANDIENLIKRGVNEPCF